MVRVAGVVICILLLSLPVFYNIAAAEMQHERPKSPIIVTTDKTNYHTGETVKIEGHVPEVTNGREINIIVKDANGETFTKLKVKPKSDNSFAASFQIPLHDKLLPAGKWIIKIGYAIWAAKVDINVLADEKTAVYQVTIFRPDLVTVSGSGMIRAGEQVMVVTEVKSNVERDQRMVYIVQVKDELGTTILLKWSARELNANETTKVSITWMPELEGIYILEIFVWDDIKNPTSLSLSQTIGLTIAR